MPFKILIVEDEELYADQLEMLVDKLGYEHLATLDNSQDALNCLKKDRPDLILMDVHIRGEYDGIELASLIQKDFPIPIIFITSLQDDLTFSRASRTNPLNFLVKPFNQLQLQRTIELTVKKLSNISETEPTSNSTIKKEDEIWENDFFFKSHFFIKTRQRLEKVATNEVLFLEADGHYCQIHIKEKKFLVRIPMLELSKRLPEDLFLQTHRSFMINMEKVDSLDLQDSVIIIGEKQVPLSKRNRAMVLEKLNWI